MNKSRKHRLQSVMETFFAALIVIILMLPFYIMFMMGTYSTAEIFRILPFKPGNHLLENLKQLMASNFLQYYWNSTKVAVCTTVGSVLISTMAGFGFAKFHFKGKGFLFSMVLVTMMIPTQLGLVAFVKEMKVLGWINTHLALIFPSMAHAFGVFWMTQFMKDNVPDEVLESAKIDGCNDGKAFIFIVIPFVRSAMVTLVLLVFIASWNSFLVPLILLNKQEMYTIPLGITTLGNFFRADYAVRIAGLAMGTIPLILIFALGSKYFIKGLMAGAVKG